MALLQEKIYEELYRMEPITETIQEALIQLDSQLYDITKVKFYSISHRSFKVFFYRAEKMGLFFF